MNGLKLADGSDQCRGNNSIFWDVILDDRLNEIKQVLHDNHVALKVPALPGVPTALFSKGDKRLRELSISEYA